MLLINCCGLSICIKKNKYKLLYSINLPILIVFIFLFIIWLIWCIQVGMLNSRFNQDLRNIDTECMSLKDKLKNRMIIALFVGIIPVIILPCICLKMMNSKNTNTNSAENNINNNNSGNRNSNSNSIDNDNRVGVVGNNNSSKLDGIDDPIQSNAGQSFKD